MSGSPLNKYSVGMVVLILLGTTLEWFTMGGPQASGMNTSLWSVQEEGKVGSTDKILEQAKEMPLEELIPIVRSMQQILNDRLLTPNVDLVAKYEKIDGESIIRVNRILDRGRFERLTAGRGGGAYFSFTSMTNDYDQEPDLSLSAWRFSSGFYGQNFGFIEIIEEVPMERIELDHVPEYMLDEDVAKLSKRRTSSSPAVEEGKTYIVRSIRYDKSDLVAAVQVLERDRYGVTFAWKILKRFNTPLGQQ